MKINCKRAKLMIYTLAFISYMNLSLVQMTIAKSTVIVPNNQTSIQPQEYTKKENDKNIAINTLQGIGKLAYKTVFVAGAVVYATVYAYTHTSFDYEIF